MNVNREFFSGTFRFNGVGLQRCRRRTVLSLGCRHGRSRIRIAIRLQAPNVRGARNEVQKSSAG